MSKMKKIILTVGVLTSIIISSENLANAYTNRSYNVFFAGRNQRATLTVCNGYAHAGTYQNYSNGYVSTSVSSGGRNYFKDGTRNASVGYVPGSYWSVSHMMVGGGWTNYHFS